MKSRLVLLAVAGIISDGITLVALKYLLVLVLLPVPELYPPGVFCMELLARSATVGQAGVQVDPLFGMDSGSARLGMSG